MYMLRMQSVKPHAIVTVIPMIITENDRILYFGTLQKWHHLTLIENQELGTPLVFLEYVCCANLYRKNIE